MQERLITGEPFERYSAEVTIAALFVLILSAWLIWELAI